jgi:hypothetical protein
MGKSARRHAAGEMGARSDPVMLGGISDGERSEPDSGRQGRFHPARTDRGDVDDSRSTSSGFLFDYFCVDGYSIRPNYAVVIPELSREQKTACLSAQPRVDVDGAKRLNAFAARDVRLTAPPSREEALLRHRHSLPRGRRRPGARRQTDVRVDVDRHRPAEIAEGGVADVDVRAPAEEGVSLHAAAAYRRLRSDDDIAGEITDARQQAQRAVPGDSVARAEVIELQRRRSRLVFSG